MSKKLLSFALILSMCFFIANCTVNRHIIGKGPTSGAKVEQKQWYILFGLVPLNEVNTSVMAGNAADYSIKTEYNVGDFFLSWLLSIVTISTRSVIVEK